MDKFIQKYKNAYAQIPVTEIYNYFTSNLIKDNVIVYFFKKNLFLHENAKQIVEALTELRDYPVHSVFFLYSTTKSNNYIIMFFIIKACINFNIERNEVKVTLASFIDKTKGMQIDLIVLKDFLDIIGFYREKPCVIINFMIDLYIANKLNIEVCNYICTLKQQNNSDTFIRNIVLKKLS